MPSSPYSATTISTSSPTKPALPLAHAWWKIFCQVWNLWLHSLFWWQSSTDLMLSVDQLDWGAALKQCPRDLHVALPACQMERSRHLAHLVLPSLGVQCNSRCDGFLPRYLKQFVPQFWSRVFWATPPQWGRRWTWPRSGGVSACERQCCYVVGFTQYIVCIWTSSA